MEKVYRIADFPLDEETLMLQETLFHCANGYLGVRGNLEENVPEDRETMRGTYINGFFDVIPMKQAESLCGLVEEKDTMLNVADLQSVKIAIDGEEFSMFSGELLSLSRSLDMDAGTASRSVLWRSPLGKETSLSFRRMASFTRKNVFIIECTIAPLQNGGTVRLTSSHVGLVRNYSAKGDPRIGSESAMLLRPEKHEMLGGASWLTSSARSSKLEVCTAVRHELSKQGSESVRYDEKDHSYVSEFSVTLQPGESLRFVKYCVVTDSLRSGDCLNDARCIMEQSYGKADDLYREQKEFLREYWENSLLEIDSDDGCDIAMLFNQYQLLQSCGRDGRSSVASKGLSGEGYEGHYFWDTEIYIMPYLSVTNPDMARSLLSYRYRSLPLARENARIMGHKSGALFPWRTISGRECSGFFPAGSAQYHINGDIAYAAVQYYLCTGDRDYLLREGAEILIETARLWLDVGNFHEGRFVINDVTGPDEYTCIVNNNYYTNASAKHNLYWAWHLSEILSDDWGKVVSATGVTDAELSQFRKASELMYLPYDGKLGINPQDDSFLQKPLWDIEATPKENFPLLLHYHPLTLYRHQVCKQADTVLAYFLFGNESKETQLRSYEYYEKLTTHDSSLSGCVFSIVASRLGLYGKAWHYFGDSVKSDLTNNHGNTQHGIHTANMGGSYMMIVNGFAGLRITEAGLELAPFVPPTWRGYRFPVRYHGSVIELSAAADGCRLKLRKGGKTALKLYGESVVLTPEQPEYACSRIKAIVFDLDGVICSTDEFHYKAWKKLADRLGIYFDRRINDRLRGVSRMASLDIVLEKSDKEYSPEEKLALAAEKNETYKALLATMTPDDLSAEVKSTLDCLRQRGYKMAIGSSSKNTKQILRQIGLEGYFDAVSDGTNISRSKPDPEVFLCAASYLGIVPELCLVVEDAEAGIQAAKNAGMSAAGIAGAADCPLTDHRLRTFSDILEFLP